jgi:LEA14-like dessication related protein
MSRPVCAKAACAAVALVCAFVLSACQSLGAMFTEPRLSIRSMDITGINFTGFDMLCKVNVENPNPIDIPFPEIDWDFFVNTNSFLKGVVKNDNVIKSQRTTVVDIPLRMTYADLFNTVMSLKDSKEADYLFSMGIQFALPLLRNKVWRLEHAGTFPVLRVPALSFKGLVVKNMSLGKLDFELYWEVENRNGFAMDVKELAYSLAVNNSRWITGNVPGAPRLQPDQKTLIPLRFSLNNLAMVQDISAIISKGADVVYDCGGNMRIGGGLPGLGDFTIPYNLSGTTKLWR